MNERTGYEWTFEGSKLSLNGKYLLYHIRKYAGKSFGYVILLHVYSKQDHSTITSYSHFIKRAIFVQFLLYVLSLCGYQ